MSKQEYCHMMRSTNNGQRKLILETIHRLHLSDSIPIQIFFTGPAGSGKTYVLKLLMETYNRYTQQHNSLRNAFVACASTGKAAVILGGVTVHYAFKITQSRRIGTMAREVLQNYRSTFIGVKCIIIDEVSMIGCDVLHKINLRLQEITGAHDQPFGNLNIIFCGDLHQLPPVNASPVYKGPRNSICGNRSTTIHSNRSRAWCKVNVPATVRLFHRNHDVDAYNNNAFIPDFENIADDKMIGYNTLTEVATARRNLHKMSVVESGGLPYSLKLAVGYPYMITMNLDVEDGLVNGAIGTLKYIEYLTEDEQVTIYGTTEVGVEPQPSTSTKIRKRWTPIVTRAANIPLGGNIKCRRNQFPVVSASVITIHKSQGGTFDEVVFNYDKSQQIQLVYVALSRVTSIDGLYLTNNKDDFKFYHGRGSTAPTVKDIRDEYDRMANPRLPTLSMQARAFCKRDVLAERAMKTRVATYINDGN
ncbi:ATP-dependent DNA helicase PIF1 [Trichonephila clavipes]|nr:ATP-dependent DNA helicase PIF1 [Trichonephila clavipes]